MLNIQSNLYQNTIRSFYYYFTSKILEAKYILSWVKL